MNDGYGRGIGYNIEYTHPYLNLKDGYSHYLNHEDGEIKLSGFDKGYGLGWGYEDSTGRGYYFDERGDPFDSDAGSG